MLKEREGMDAEGKGRKEKEREGRILKEREGKGRDGC